MTFASIDETHDPKRTSWVESANGHPDFPIQNLPLGIFSMSADDEPRGGVAIGDKIVDLKALVADQLVSGDALRAAEAACETSLNSLLALGPVPRVALRRALSDLLSDESRRDAMELVLVDAEAATLHLPTRIGDYTDFFVGIHHATNIGKLFRPDNPLLPNYKYVPIGYHGRASSVRPSGEPVVRPSGQRRGPDDDAPQFGPSRRLDYELELGIWVGEGNDLGDPVPIGDAGNHIAGLSLLNDWSARDLQAWEYQPLGPFLAKNFMSTISPWIVTTEALAPFRVSQPGRPEGDPKPLPYLWDDADQGKGAFSITLETYLTTSQMRSQGMDPYRLSHGPASNMYWTVAQMLAHHASNGCNLNPGDLLGSGTISAPDRDGFGSLIEISSSGKDPLELPTGEKRSFLEDGDEVVISAQAHADGFVSIGFGPCAGCIQEARSN